MMESNQSASRAARRFLTERVRTDWDWPQTPECWSASDEEVRGITHFRERYYGTTSEPDSDNEAAGEDEKDRKRERAADPYKFDSPDSIAQAVETRIESRRRRRREALESEAAWNDGLAQFLARRDAWTGVAAVLKYGTRRPGKDAMDAHTQLASDSDQPLTPDTTSSSSSSSHSRSRPVQPLPPHEGNAAQAQALVPVAPTLLPGNAIRDSIAPKAYHDIYEKVVVSSRTPTVPINLSDMTRALVQGWKDNGEWPPKSGPLDPLAGRKRAMLAGVRLDAEGPFLSHHPHVRRGVDSVRRIFHLNGHHESPAPGQSAPAEQG